MRIECDFRPGLAKPTITRGPDGPVLSLTHGRVDVIIELSIELSEESLGALCLALVESIASERC